MGAPIGDKGASTGTAAFRDRSTEGASFGALEGSSCKRPSSSIRSVDGAVLVRRTLQMGASSGSWECDGCSQWITRVPIVDLMGAHGGRDGCALWILWAPRMDGMGARNGFNGCLQCRLLGICPANEGFLEIQVRCDCIYVMLMLLYVKGEG